MYLHSISAYVDKIVDELDQQSVVSLREISFEQLGILHHSWGMAIRNQFGLWKEDHPLTASWHARPELQTMVDESSDHPDVISMRIMEGVWKKVNT